MDAAFLTEQTDLVERRQKLHLLGEEDNAEGKTVQIRRADAKLPEGAFFLADIIGLEVVDEDGQKLGVLKEVLSPSIQQVYVVAGEREILIPAVPQFILETNIEGGYIKVRLIEGM